MSNICKGCGAQIQFDNEQLKGFIEKNVFERRTLEKKEILCKRCFRLSHYNESEKIIIDEINFEKIAKDFVQSDMLVVYIVDCFDLDGTFINDINKIFPNNHILLVANKYDLFMRSNRPTKIKKYINNILKEKNITVSGISITSTIEEISGEKLYKTIENTIQGFNLSKKVFLFGMSNVGKSTLLNSILKYKKVSKTKQVTVSSLVNTTLSINEIDFCDFIIYDTPGIVNKKQVTYYLSKKSIDYVTPKVFVKPIIFQLNPNQTIFVNGFASISYLGGNNNSDINYLNKFSIVCYYARQIVLHRTKYENHLDFLKNHQDDILKYPKPQERKALGQLVTYRYDVDSTQEISLSGLGFFGFSGEGTIEIETYENILVTKRAKLI